MRLRFIALPLALVIAATLSPSAQAETTTTIVAVGDIARAGGGQAKTAALTKNLNPNQVLIMGDLAYNKGSVKEFKKYFLPKWSSLLNKTWAVPGNHEYRTKNATGYRNLVAKYSLPSTNGNLWWVQRSSDWTIIGLDSEALKGATGQQQITFLNQALAENNGRPTIVTWHRPTFTRGEHGNQTDTNSIWDIVAADKDVKLVLWGHDHNYEQVERTVQAGTADEHKLNTILVGTGGAELRKCSTPNVPGELICGKKKNYGVLSLTLKSNSVAWSYRNADGSKLGKELDSGTVSF